MDVKNRNSQCTYSMKKEVFEKIEDLYHIRIARKEKASRSGVVAEAVTKLWETEHEDKSR